MDIHDVINNHLCIGCGLCYIDDNIFRMVYNDENGCFIPEIKFDLNYELADNICPGKGYNIIELGKINNNNYNSKYDLELGYYSSFFAARMKDNNLLINSSSGGVMSGVLLYLLEEKIVDKVSVTKFITDADGLKTKTFLTNNVKDILDSQGSKYCPVNYNELLDELKLFEGRVAIVGTPCVIAGIKGIQNLNNNDSIFRSQIVISLTNFCGGFKSYDNIKRLANIHKIKFHNISEFRFRGGGQPGSLRIVSNDGKVAETPYPNYVGLTGYSKMLRCHLCVDATGELADLSFGDAWIPRFENDEKAWSIVVARSKIGEIVLSKIIESRKMVTEEISLHELKYSQRFNINSKKNRQSSRMRLYKFFGYKIPVFDGGYYIDKIDFKTEIIVFFKHKFKLLLEKLGLYFLIYGKSKL